MKTLCTFIIATVAGLTAPAQASTYFWTGSGPLTGDIAINDAAFEAVSVPEYNPIPATSAAGDDIYLRVADTYYVFADSGGGGELLPEVGGIGLYDYATDVYTVYTGSSVDPLVLAGGARRMVPEPASLALLTVGSLCLLRRRPVSSAV